MIKNIKFIISNFLILTLNSSSAVLYAQTSTRPHDVLFKKEGRLEFSHSNNEHRFKSIDIEIADTSKDRAHGLMWRSAMKENQGMLFIYERERPLSFWMKNTYFPLDVIFIDKSSRIISVYSQTIPQNETSIFSEKPAQYVIEVIAGFCNKFGIKEGDEIHFERIK